MTATGQQDVRELSARLRDLSTAVAVVLGLAMLFMFAMSLLYGVREGVSVRETLDELGQMLIIASPAIFYLCALWAVRRVFGRLAKEGARFHPTLAGGLRDVGWNLAWGAGMDVLGSPLLLRWVDGEPGGSVAYYNPAAIALGVVGLALVLLSRLLLQAAEMQADLDHIL